MKKIIFFIIILLAVSPITHAQNFKAQQRSQEKLIKTTYKKGRITEREYYKLMQEQELIKEAMNKYYADDILTPSEKNRLYDKLQRAAKRLKRYKTNGEIY